ncbi:hypothetical protein PsorP6_014538 [Peronosclerospora sorghi]|uniref:Uncharacterized protein n=1 Tax=Peronosclerospora sorghi TaxID=230839 RepID=A0ACC0VQV7_9STRA|nr:hypothetical protein PsorP6_014538 [Peronosclerospora sorghi]
MDIPTRTLRSQKYLFVSKVPMDHIFRQETDVDKRSPRYTKKGYDRETTIKIALVCKRNSSRLFGFKKPGENWFFRCNETIAVRASIDSITCTTCNEFRRCNVLNVDADTFPTSKLVSARVTNSKDYHMATVKFRCNFLLLLFQSMFRAPQKLFNCNSLRACNVLL